MFLNKKSLIVSVLGLMIFIIVIYGLNIIFNKKENSLGYHLQNADTDFQIKNILTDKEIKRLIFSIDEPDKIKSISYIKEEEGMRFKVTYIKSFNYAKDLNKEYEQWLIKKNLNRTDFSSILSFVKESYVYDNSLDLTLDEAYLRKTGNCLHMVNFVKELLNFYNISYKTVVGTYKGEEHVWLSYAGEEWDVTVTDSKIVNKFDYKRYN